MNGELGVLLAIGGDSGPVLPAWMVVPPALILVIAVGSHMMAMRESPMPESRKRLRTANGVVMMLTAPLTAYAFCAVSPQDPRFFVLTWAAVLGMVGIVIALAVADIVNNLFLARQHTRALRAHLREFQQSLIEYARQNTDAKPPVPPAPPH